MNSIVNRIVLVSVIYTFLFFYFTQLDYPLRGDEAHFWQSSLHFSEMFIPSFEVLRSYTDMNTPLPFYIFGQIHHITGAGPQGGRLLNLLLSVFVVLVIALNTNKRSLYYSLVLLLFPYYWGTSISLYTDMLCGFFVLLGLIAYRSGNTVWSLIMFTLAVASRQYAIAFPVALAAYSLVQLNQTFSRLEREKLVWTVIAMSVAILSIVPWIILWQGVAPPKSITAAGLDTGLFRFFADHPLYFMACVGFYFVLPEIIIDRRWSISLQPLKLKLGLVVLICVVFLYFPPLQNVEYSVPQMGFLDKLSRFVLSDSLRMLWFCLLASIAGIRFMSVTPMSFLFWSNALLMLKAPISWDKYIMLLLICLWYLKAASRAGNYHNEIGEH